VQYKLENVAKQYKAAVIKRKLALKWRNVASINMA
jgi:hypothetical protein